MMYMMTEQEHAQIVDALEHYQVKRQDFDRFADELAMLKAMQPVTQEPIAYFDFQKNRFRWAPNTSIGPVPVCVRVEPMALYSAPTHIGNVDSICTSQERVQKLEENVQMLLEALRAMLTHMGMDEDEWNKPTFDQARAAINAMEKT